MLLRLISEFSEIEKELATVKFKEDISIINSQWKIYKSALADLIAMGKGANVRAETATKRALKLEEDSRKRVAEFATADAEGMKRKSQKVSKPDEQDLFKVCREEGACAEEFAVHGLSVDRKTCQAKLLEKVPFIVRVTKAELDAMPKLRAELDAFKTRLASSSARATQGRGQRSVVATALPEVTALFEALFTREGEKGQKELLEPIVPDEQRELHLSEILKGPQVYAVAAGKEVCAMETGASSTIRFQHCGTREVVCISIVKFAEWFNTRSARVM